MPKKEILTLVGKRVKEASVDDDCLTVVLTVHVCVPPPCQQEGLTADGIPLQGWI